MLSFPKFHDVSWRLRKMRVCSKYLNYMRKHTFIDHKFEKGRIVYSHKNGGFAGFTAKPKCEGAIPVHFKRAIKLRNSYALEDLF